MMAEVKRGKFLPWSYSSLTSFENCAFRHYTVKVLKVISDPPTQQIKWGQDVHKALERRVVNGAPLPATMRPYQKVPDRLAQVPGGKVFAEQRMCIDASFNAADWWADNGWCRGQVDVGVEKNERVVILDYKTGKRKPDSDQLMLFAALTFAHRPHVNTVDTGFVWLRDNCATDSETYTRDQLPEIWNSFLPRVARMKNAFDKNEWPEKPSGLCGWCPLTRDQCRFSKKGPQ